MNALKSEEDIKSDLEKNEYMYSDCPVQIKNVSIIRRQTDKDAKTDTIYVSVESETKYAQRTDSWIVEYGYYDDIGWDYNSHEFYPDGEVSCEIKNGPNSEDVDSWFKMFNDSQPSFPYTDWSIESVDFNDSNATVVCTATSGYSIPDMEVNLTNKENVEIYFWIGDYGAWWDCGTYDENYYSEVTDVSFSKPISATLNGHRDWIVSPWFRDESAEPDDSNYKLDISSIDISNSDGFVCSINATCEAYEYVDSNNFDGYSQYWNCHDFIATDVDVDRYAIIIDGVCTDDHITKKDEDDSETSDTRHHDFRVKISPFGMELKIASAVRPYMGSVMAFSST